MQRELANMRHYKVLIAGMAAMLAMDAPILPTTHEPQFQGYHKRSKQKPFITIATRKAKRKAQRNARKRNRY